MTTCVTFSSYQFKRLFEIVHEWTSSEWGKCLEYHDPPSKEQ